MIIPSIKQRKKPYVFKGLRDRDIRENIQPIIDALIRNYWDSDPAKGEETEARKSEIAAQTIELFWELFDELGAWAQDQISGKLWTLENADLSEELAGLLKLHPLTEDSHLVERIGFECRESNTAYADPVLFFLGQKEEELSKEYINHLSIPAKRRLTRELLAARSESSAFWREALSEALHALNYGQTIEFLAPDSTRRRAEFFHSLDWKCAALCHVNFLMGKGIKKYVALETVSKAINQSPETLRSWEKLLSEDDQFAADMYAARLAGQFEVELKTKTLDEMNAEYGDASFRNKSYWYLAIKQLERFPYYYSLERIRDRLNEVRREPPKVVRKRVVKTPE